MKKRNLSLFLIVCLFLLPGCLKDQISSNNIEQKAESPLVLEDEKEKNIEEETLPEYPFEECGKPAKFVHYDWFVLLREKIATIKIANTYHYQDELLPVTEKSIADMCFSKTANRVILIIHPPASAPNVDRNQEWRVLKFFPETGGVLVVNPLDFELSIYEDSVEFGKREGAIIKIHTLDRWAAMYTKHEYDYNYIENTLKRKISCSYDDREPGGGECY